jgi:PAS domain S-box-containing protein
MSDAGFLHGGGEMGERMRTRDWSTSPLGDPSGWPQSLRSVVALMINSRYPMFCAWGPELAFLYNDGYAPIFGAKHPHMLGVPFREAWDEIWDDISPLVERALSGESTYHENFYLVMERNGYPEDTWYDFSYSPVLDDDGAIAGMFCACTEKTGQLSADRALRESEAHLRAVFDQLSEGVIFADKDGKLGLVNRAAEEIHGVASLDVGPNDYSEVYHLFTEDGRPYPPAELPLARAVNQGATVDDARWRIRRPDGSEVLAIGSARPIRDDEGKQIGSVLTLRDDTPRFEAEQALRERSEEFYTLADNIPALAWMAYADGNIFWYNRRWYEFTGTSEEDQKGWGWESVHDPDLLPAVTERWTKSLERGLPFEMTFPLRGADGVFRPFLTRAVPVRNDAGQILRWFGTNVDISEQVEAEQAVTRLNQTLEQRVLEIAAERERAWQLSQELLAVINADGTFAEINVAWTTLLGWESNELLGQGFGRFTHPDDREATEAKFAATLKTPLTEPYEYRLRQKDGSYRWFSWTAIFEHGRLYASGRDVNAEKERQAALESAQEALRQSQKMETIGQLTGGIAHDFNNLLQVITGNLDIIRRTLPDDMTRQARAAANAMKGADRAAVLTQRLLAFARRQPLAPKVIDANKLVTGMSEMLHRTLGENFSIETVLGSGLWQVEVDPNQLESALLNLAVNARDAMGEGGKLTIETTNAHIDRSYADEHSGVLPGQYSLICVSDTGAGMDPATAERAVEPFFTTKDVGKGTGLGLSMVYGFVKQSGGHFKIYSEPSEGTTVKIYLPRHHGDAVLPDERTDDRPPDRSNGETILVCEDDADVRLFTADTLRDLGYRVIEADSGEEALRLLGDEPEVALLFTDVVLPGITGAVLAEKAKAMRPDLPVLYTTGYARNAIVHHGRLDAGVELLSKPFTRADLALRIRDLIETPPS